MINAESKALSQHILNYVAVHVVLFLKLEMTAPVDATSGSVGAVEELNKAHAALDQPPGEDAVVGEGSLMSVVAARAVQFADVCRFSFEVGSLSSDEAAKATISKRRKYLERFVSSSGGLGATSADLV